MDHNWHEFVQGPNAQITPTSQCESAFTDFAPSLADAGQRNCSRTTFAFALMVCSPAPARTVARWRAVKDR